MKKIISLLIFIFTLSACGATPPMVDRIPPEVKMGMIEMVREGNLLGFSSNEFKVAPGTSKEFYFVLMNPNENSCIDISINFIQAKEGGGIPTLQYPERIKIPVNDAKIYPIIITMPENANSQYLAQFQAFECGEPESLAKQFPFASKSFYVNAG